MSGSFVCCIIFSVTAVQLPFLTELWSLCNCLFWVCAILIISFITAVFSDWVVPMLLHVIFSVFLFFLSLHISVYCHRQVVMVHLWRYLLCVLVSIVARLQIMVTNLVKL